MVGIRHSLSVFAAVIALGSSGVASVDRPAPVAAAVQATAPAVTRTAPAAFAADGSFIVPRSGDGLFYVDAAINGQSVRFLVDTGANITVLTRRDASRLGLTYVPSRRGNSMATVGGPTRIDWTRIPEMNVAERPLTDIEAVVVEQGIQVSLLGQNALAQLEGITFSGDRLRIH